MPARTFWKGRLKFSLVSCAVTMTPATTDREKLRFRTLSAETGNPVRSRYVDETTGRPVDDADVRRGYPAEGGGYVALEDEELESVALESARTIDLETFAPRDSIGWIWLDRPHHVLPDDAEDAEAYAVLREAMRRTDTVGIARLVLYRRERAMMIEPCGAGLLAWTLRYGDEVREPDGLFDLAAGPADDPKLLDLIGELIEARRAPWSPAMVTDPVQDALKATIARKRRKTARPKPRPARAAEEPDNVVSILEALRRSVESERGGRR